MSKNYFQLAAVAAVLLAGALFLTHFYLPGESTNRPSQQNNFLALTIKGVQLQVEVAETQTELAQGLSGREILPQNSGMLFIFPAETKPSFWMKEMNFGLDIIWLDSAKRVVQIDQNVLPATYPATFRPVLPVRYVLEVNAGFAASHQISVGDGATW